MQKDYYLEEKAEDAEPHMMDGQWEIRKEGMPHHKTSDDYRRCWKAAYNLCKDHLKIKNRDKC